MQPNLIFNGNAADVLAHYRDVFGGELEIMRFAGSPAAEEAPPGWGDKVVYGTLQSPLGIVHAMDAPPGRTGEPGDNFAISIQTPTEAATDSVFAKLSAGGAVTMPREKTFWSPKFGMCTDKFGVKWMVSLAPTA